MPKKKITFLFGAGAENFDLINYRTGEKMKNPSCEEFKRELINSPLAPDIYDYINFNNKFRPNNGLLINWNSYSTLYQTITECNKDLGFDEEDTEKINKYIELKKSPNEEKDSEITKEFSKLFKEKIYDSLKQGLFDKPYVKNYLKNVAIYSYIDSLFNYLKDPEKEEYKSKISTVIKLYFSAFNSMLHLSKDDIQCDKNSKDVKANRELLNKKIKDFNQSILPNNCYYKEIHNAIKDAIEIKVVTTNYTEFAERELDLSNIGNNKSICYIHGKLNLFEDLYTKNIKKIDEFDEKDIIFPYLMVPSGIKPLIGNYQVKEFSKAIEFFDNSDEIIILGYNVNHEDEHISQVLRTKIKDKNVKVTFVYYEKDNDEEKISQIKKRINKDLFSFSNEINYINSNALIDYLKNYE